MAESIEFDTYDRAAASAANEHDSRFEQDTVERPSSQQMVDLPPVDTGFGAYSYLFANFVLELLVWSYAFSYAIFLPYYTNVLFPHNNNLSILSLIGTLATGIMYVAALVVMNVCSRWPKLKRPTMIGGLVISTSALVCAAFATKPLHLLLTQGVMFSIGGSALYYPASSLMFEWFVERRGLANGLILSGTGIGGVVVPFIVNGLLHKHGIRLTFLAMAAVMCGCVLPVLPFLKPRVPATSATSRQPVRINFAIFKTVPFLCLMLCNWLQSLGHSIPSLYLPAFAADLHLTDANGVLVLALLNGASVPGRIFLGFCSDRFDLRVPILISCGGAAVVVLLLWGFATSLAPLVTFAILYGFLGGGFSAMWPRFVSNIAKDDPHTSYLIYATFFAGRGAAYILSTPISTGLIQTRSSWGSASARIAYGMKGYGIVIFFTGMILLGSTIGVAFRSFKNVQRASRPISG